VRGTKSEGNHKVSSEEGPQSGGLESEP